MVNKGYALIDASTDKLDISVIPVDDIIKSETFTDVEIDEGGTLNATTVLSALASNILESNQESLIDGTTPNYEIQDLKCQAVTFIVDTANTSGHFEDINENPLSIGGAPEDARDNFLIQPSHKVFLNSGENNYEVYINVINNTGSGDNDVEISDTNGETVTIPTGSYSVTAINGIEIFQFSGDYYARKTRVGTENTVTFGTSTGTENNLGLYSKR